jgi:hypothetical protein
MSLPGLTGQSSTPSTVKNRRKLRLAGTSVRIVGLDFAGFQGVGVDFLAKSK